MRPLFQRSSILIVGIVSQLCLSSAWAKNTVSNFTGTGHPGEYRLIPTDPEGLEQFKKNLSSPIRTIHLASSDQLRLLSTAGLGVHKVDLVRQDTPLASDQITRPDMPAQLRKTVEEAMEREGIDAKRFMGFQKMDRHIRGQTWIDNKGKPVFSLNRSFIDNPDETQEITLEVKVESPEERKAVESLFQKIKNHLAGAAAAGASGLALAAMMMGAFKREGFRVFARLSNSNANDIVTVTHHELAHVKALNDILEGKGDFSKEFLSTSSPYHKIARAYLEVDAGMHERGHGEVNIPYLSSNTFDLLQLYHQLPTHTTDPHINQFKQRIRDKLNIAMDYLQTHNT